MKRVLQVFAVLIVLVALGVGWYVYSKQLHAPGHGDAGAPARLGHGALRRPWRTAYPRRENEADLYRALGYVHAQDRLFQMEIMRRLARGELAEVLGPKLLETDKLFRSLRIRERALSYVEHILAQPRPRPCKPTLEVLQWC